MATPSYLTLMVFPQRFDGRNLTFNILVAPRNSSPLEPLYPGSAPFATANLQLRARVISGLSGFPMESSVSTTALTFTTNQGAIPVARSIFQTLLTQYNPQAPSGEIKLPAARGNHFIKKYLPESYRGAFNFQRPSSDKAVIDSSYRCAVRDAKRGKNPNFKPSPETITWGQIYAFCLRQPILARQIGLIREANLDLQNNNLFEKGGFLYVDLNPTGDYGSLIHPDRRLYAARIPALTTGNRRTLFAPVLFPVLPNGSAAPLGNFDPIFFEAANYDDGFTKIVHANQPLNADLLEEKKDDNPPLQDIGIRLGWDDEQVLTWLNRQMEVNSEDTNSKRPIDAPLGVFGYRVDLRLPGQTTWTSLCAVRSRNAVQMGNQNLGQFQNELCVEVHPSQMDGFQEESHYWLPHFFANWGGKSMVLPDVEAATLYRNDRALDRSIQLSNHYDPVGLESINLRYGQEYQFRVRLADLSGGGPLASDAPTYESPAPHGVCQFKRYVAPAAPRIENLSGGALFELNTLSIQRPGLEYPAVLYTNKYSNALQLLRNKTQNDSSRAVELTLPDPDVNRVRIDVEIETLQMDNLGSISGKEAYIHYYSTYRNFPNFNRNQESQAPINIPLTFRDAPVLDLSEPENPSKDILGIPLSDLNQRAELVLPTARKIRLHIKAVGNPDVNYYGRPRSHIGKSVQILLNRPAQTENTLFLATSPSERIKGIYLRADENQVISSAQKYKNYMRAIPEVSSNLPSIIERLAGQLDLRYKGLTLQAENGRRVQFGCSSHIGHSLSPDHSSLTFADKGELSNQWIVALRLELNRDWTWNGLSPDSFTVRRTFKFAGSNNPTLSAVVGEIEMTRTASINDIRYTNRSGTTLFFIDAVDPKPKRGGFPDEVELSYTVTPKFMSTGVRSNTNWRADLLLPTSIPPIQIPVIRSAGFALSPYTRDERYSSTQVRQRYLWIELEEAIADPKDALFARVLAVSPDPMLCKFAEETEIPDEPALSLDPEHIRVIYPGQADDHAGLDAMQALIPAIGSDRHFLLPLPSGYHPESPELFGFFTYELRVGHSQVWSTAQGRFGRPLRATGIQHPAPTLLSLLSRNELGLNIQAHYAKAVINGRNVTANPPRTELWAFLYAQVRQADGQDYRNILLGEKQMNPSNPTPGAGYNRDRTTLATCFWKNNEINLALNLRGLSNKISLSVVCVEFFPENDSLIEPILIAGSSIQPRETTVLTSRENATEPDPAIESTRTTSVQIPFSNSKIAEQLGHRRILRTSPLTKVPAVCKGR